MIILPFFGALLEALCMTIEKKVLRKHKMDYRNYSVYGFLAMVLVMIPFIFFFWRVDIGALKLTSILIFLSVIGISVLANIFGLYSLKREKVTEIEPIRLMQPLFTILLAFIFSFFFTIYAGERNPLVLLLALIASVALVLSHVEKHHLKLNKYLIAAIASSFFFSLELVISRSILDFYSPLSFYFFRCLFIFIVCWIIFHPSIKTIKNKTRLLIFLGAISAVIYRVIVYYGFLTLGIVFTTILFIVAPIFVYIFAKIFLKEKIKLRQIIASIIIIACVIASIFLQI
jgi:drug/metabolite transporter (DMT)-like permease